MGYKEFDVHSVTHLGMCFLLCVLGLPYGSMASFRFAFEQTEPIKLKNDENVTLSLLLEIDLNMTQNYWISLQKMSAANETEEMKKDIYNFVQSMHWLQIDDGIIFNYTIPSSLFPVYGFYSLKLQAPSDDSSNATQEIEFTLVHDQGLEDLVINCEKFVSMESGNISLSGTVTGGVSLGIDWIWNIDDNQRVITNNLSHSTLQYSVTECRDVNVEVIARNPVSETSAFCVQRVLYPLQGYVIEPLTGFYQTTDQVEITLRSGSQNFPVGNTTLQILTNETSTGTLLINISLTNTDLQDGIQFQHSFIEQGCYNVYGSLKSEINIVNLSTIVGIWDKLENLDLNISKLFISVYDSIQLTWIFPPRSDFSFKISYGDGTHRTHSASDNHIFSGTSWLKAYNSVGRYTFSVFAWNAVYSKNISHSVQVEESITNVELKCTKYVSTKEGSTILNAVVDRGADLGVEWIWRVNHTFHESQSSNQNYTSLQYQISQTGNLHIGILARNNISEMSTSCLVIILDPIDGFYIDIPNIYYETTETINFTIKTILDNSYPVGITSLNLKINDTSGSNVIDLANLTDDQVKSGLFLQHAFELQGNYKIFGNISSVNESKFMEVVVRIWDKLDGLNFRTSSTAVTILENFDLELTSTPRSYFNFILHFGDGTLLENEKDSYKDRFFQTPLSKNYSAIGNYEICCRGWNEVYSTKVCSFMLCENNIDAIMLTCDFPRHVRVGTELDFMTSIINGAEMEITWTWIFQPLNFQRTVTTENNITEISFRKEIGLDGGEINITVIAANKVSEVSDSCSVVSLHPIQELRLHAETYQTLETAYIYIQNTSLTLYPQGIITAVGYLQNENGSVLLQNFTKVSDEKIQREEVRFSHIFDVQGDYVVNVNIFTVLNDTKTLSTSVQIWDKLVQIKVKASKTALRVNEIVYISMESPSRSHFDYSFFYGDGTKDERITGEYDKMFNETIYVKKYSEPGNYTVTLHVMNKLYSETSSIDIIVEYPINTTHMEVYPREYRVPHPDGHMEFTLVHPEDNILPSNVKCEVDFRDNIYSYENNVFRSIPRHTISNTFVFTGTKDVIFRCTNSVSSKNLISTVNVTSFNLNDFNLIFTNPIMMNMTRKPSDPFDTEDVPNFAFFKINLKNCDRLPYNMIERWDFGDNHDNSYKTIVNNTGLDRRHLYSSRGHLQITVNISLGGKGSYLYSTHIDSGSLIAHCNNTKVDFRRNNFKITLEMVGNASFEFDTDSGNVTLERTYNSTSDITSGVAFFTFGDYGFYMPKITGQNHLGVESIYLKSHLTADFNLTGELKLHTGLENNNLLLVPPGQLRFEIRLANHLKSHLYRPLVNCSFISGDEIDRAIHSKKHNITATSPLTFDYTYFDLGRQSINVRCFNFISQINLEDSIILTDNECFGHEGIFDRTYSMPTIYFILYGNDEVYISNRMSIICTEMIRFRWELTDTRNVSKDAFYLFPDTREGTCLLKENVLEEGKYKLTLNISIPDKPTYLVESLFIEITEPELFFYILGGISRTVFINKLVQFQASTYYSDNTGVEYYWECASFTSRETQFSCEFENPGTYFVSLKVLKNGKEHIYTQTIEAMQLETDTSTFSIKCVVNCVHLNERISVGTKFGLTSECSGCKDDNKTYLYQWSLVSQAQEMQLPDTKTNSVGFAVSREILNPDTEYVIFLSIFISDASNMTGADRNVSIMDEPPFVKLSMKFKTNIPPVGGSCDIKYEPDIVAISANCSGWKNGRRQDTLLLYRYETIIRRLSEYGEVEDIVDHIYTGREPSISHLPIQVGDIQFDNNVTVQIKIYDIYYDYEVVEKHFTIETPQIYVPANGGNVTKALLLITTFNDKIGPMTAGGDHVRTFRYIASIASMIHKYPNEMNTTTSEDIIGGSVDHVTFYKESDVEILYENFLINITNIMVEDVKNVSDLSYKIYSLSEISSILSGIDAVVRHTVYIKFNSLRNILRVFLDISQCFVSRVKHKEVPLRNHDVSTLNEIVNHFVRILNNLIEVLIPKQWIDFNEEFSFLSVLSELVHIFGTHIDADLIDQGRIDDISQRLREKAKSLFELQTYERNITTIQREIMIEYFQKIQDTIMDVQLLTLKTIVTGEKLEFQKPLIKLITDKTTYGDFRGTYINDEMKKNSYILGLSNLNNTFFNPNTLLNVMVIVYKRNPFIFGGNSSSLTSDVFVFHFGNNSDNNNLQLELNLENKINTNNSYLRLFQGPMTDEMIFYKFNVSNDDDVIILFLKPQNFNLDLSRLSLFEIYISENPFPSNYSTKDNGFQASTTVRNWDEEYGFKVFVPSGVCLKGHCYLGIQPLGVAKLVKDLDKKDKQNETLSPNFQLLVITTTCRSWDRVKQAWISERCTVLPLSTINNTVCRCPGNTFSTTFVVPPNAIDFRTVWGKFDPNNGAVYGSLIVLMVFYVAALLLLKREDKKDMNRWRISFLCDHDFQDEYFYTLTVTTGFRRHAGTSSNIHFVLTGTEDDTGIRILNDGEREAFTTGSVFTFFFGTKSTLGTLQFLRIWHDNSGKGSLQDWFLSNIEIVDLQTNEKYIFACDKWLSLYKDDCVVDRILGVATVEVAKSFHFLFPKNFQVNITEHHMWLSLVYRPKKTKFTRVQRLSCLLALLHLNMVSNAMFYKSPSDNTSESYVEFGGFQFSSSILYVSLMSIIITTLPVLLLTMLFRKRKIKKCLHAGSEESQNGFSIPPNVVNENEDGLPYCVVYVAWIFLVLTVLTSAFFLILYSMEWGKEKSEEWLLSFFLSFLESVFIVDPMKVLLMAVLFASLLKTAMAEESSNISLQKLKKYSNKQILSNKYDFAVFARKILSKQEPLGEEDINKIREQHEQEKRVKKAVKSLVLNVVFLLAIYTISFVERDPTSYSYKNNIDNYLHTGDLSSIRQIPDLINWLNDTFIPTFYPEKDAADNDLDTLEKQWFADRVSIRVGPAQLRQLRIKADACSVRNITPSYPCYEYYSIAEADTSQYCIGWKKLNPSCLEETESDRYFTKTSWSYTRAEDIWGIPYTGEYNTYDGGGYLIKFTKDRYQARMMLNEIFNLKWIDRGTRAVFIEFTLYNPNLNMFLTSKYLTEFLETGGILVTLQSQAFRPVAFVSSAGPGLVLFYVLFIAYLVFLLIKILNKIRQGECLQFLRVPWDCVTLSILVLGISSICLYIVRIIYANKAMQLFYDDKLTDANQFINFNHIIIWDNVLNVVFSLVIFLSTIKLLKVLGYNKRLTQVISVISYAGYDILVFGIIFLLSFFGFVILGTLLLGRELEDYKSFLYTCGTLSNSFIGKNKVSSMIRAAPVLAQVFYFVYSVCVIMTLVTICAAILNSSISDVKSSVQLETDKFGISHMIRRMLCDLLGAEFKDNKKVMESYNQGNVFN